MKMWLIGKQQTGFVLPLPTDITDYVFNITAPCKKKGAEQEVGVDSEGGWRLRIGRQMIWVSFCHLVLFLLDIKCTSAVKDFIFGLMSLHFLILWQLIRRIEDWGYSQSCVVGWSGLVWENRHPPTEPQPLGPLHPLYSALSSQLKSFQWLFPPEVCSFLYPKQCGGPLGLRGHESCLVRGVQDTLPL